MTDIEMLPLPASSWQLKHDDATGSEIALPTPLWNTQKMQSYAHAVAEHNVKAMREDAKRSMTDYQMLREFADRETVRADQAERQRDLAHKGWQLAESAEAEAHARAGRLAEALREIHQRAHGGCSPMDCARVAYEALRDHDQEGTNDR